MRMLRGRSERGDPGGDSAKAQQQTRDLLTVESAAQMIDSLPSDVPRESQLRIVREAFAAAGIDVSNLQSHTRTREAQLGSEIELVRNRQKELRERTQETVRALEEEIRKVQEEIRKVQEAFEADLAEEEERISPPMAALKDVERVQAFFAFPKTEGLPDMDDVPEADAEEDPTHLIKGKGFRQVQA
jgi:NAD-specific glutamate dehydrogenase